MNHLIYGANDMDIDVAGHTMGQVSEAASQILNFDPRIVDCYVDGNNKPKLWTFKYLALLLG